MDQKLLQKEKEIIIAQLDAMSPELVLSIGGDGKTFSKEELIAEINKNSEFGKKFVESQFEFLRAIKDSAFVSSLTS